MYQVGIITASDKGFQGLREDLSGKIIQEFLRKTEDFWDKEVIILPDNQSMIESTMIKWADDLHLDLILTTGGTGFSHRDVTPDATLNVVDKRAPGIPEAMRSYSLTITPRAMLSRAEAGIRGNTLIINLPGSPKAVSEILEYILPSIKHGLDILLDRDGECAR
jgi:molybdopterin adenylyltransferase